MKHTELTLTQPDWTRFLSPDGLAEKAGTSRANFPKMILKDLADNAADAGGATLWVIDADTVEIADDGSGIAPEGLAEVFSIKRPLVSTKHWRMGKRGALGNGLRAVMGGLYVLGGQLQVSSQGTTSAIHLNEQGDTVVERLGPADNTGTEITVFCPDIAADAAFARTAVQLAGRVINAARPAPFWFDVEAIRDLQRSAPGVTTRKFVSQFATNYKPGKSELVSEASARSLLSNLCYSAKRAPKINPIGPEAFQGSYAKCSTTAFVGDAEIPACVEVWASIAARNADQPAILILNRTRALADATVQVAAKGRIKVTFGTTTWSFSANERDRKTLKQSVPLAFTIAISAPFFPIVSSGKAPDMEPFALAVLDTVVKAGRAAQRNAKRARRCDRPTIKDTVFKLLPEAYERVSDGGRYHANARQLMYEMRPDILRICGIDRFSDSTVTQVAIPEFCEENPDLTAGWKVAYDARGTMYEPHTGQKVALGTVAVGAYTATSRIAFEHTVDSSTTVHTRPEERFAGLLFVEKEGFTELIRDSGILERFDLALASTKGMSTTAARALIDEMAGRVPDFAVFVAADFDITGQTIRRTLTSDTARFKFRNRVVAHHIAVTWEQSRRLDSEGRSEPVNLTGDLEKTSATLERSGLDEEAIGFLVEDARRVELNALRPAEFLETLETGIAAQSPPKVIPPEDTLHRAYAELTLRKRLKAEEERLRAEPAPTLTPAIMDRLRDKMRCQPILSWDRALFELIGGETE
ncbi:MAG: sensor histidine kinase [Rhodobacteraceae bacterium]|nr:sensor histidine kinase [Paracoccaceae bacterium]